MRVLLVGKAGQIGYELERSLQGLGEIVALDRSQMNLANIAQVREVIRTVKPSIIINAAAYTDVDKAESEPELAMCINAHAPTVMAEEAKKLGAALIQYSTNYVFDGLKQEAYTEDDVPAPINVYGHTKLAGEQGIKMVGVAHLILRTGWVYGTRGKNFLLTVLRMARESKELRIVNDQFGSPTWSRTVAELTAHIIVQVEGEHDSIGRWHEHTGLYHLTASGNTTWHGFTEAILRHAPLVHKPQVRAICTEEYPLPAARPHNSVLSCARIQHFSCRTPSWQDSLALCLQ
jgi:dTDP-4-dehydrorhamnose reductase